MKKYVLCQCGSGKAYEMCCMPSPHIRAFAIPIADDHAREEMQKKFMISKQFDLRHRGLAEFYGDDLIQYKIEKGSSKSANDFLRIFARYLTDYLEDACPTSWHDCTTDFWEEFIYFYYPHHMQLTPQQKQTEVFISHLKKFLKWLDGKHKTDWYLMILQKEAEIHRKLKTCETLTNHLFSETFPRMHHKDWDPGLELHKLAEKKERYDVVYAGIYEITDLQQDIAILTDIETTSRYSVLGLPTEMLSKGILLIGNVGKMNFELFWNWFGTETVYPEKAKSYFQDPNSVIQL